MSGIKVRVKRFRGNNINDGLDLEAVLDLTRLMPSGQANYVPRADDFSFLAGITLGGHVMPLKIAVQGDPYDLLDELRTFFYVGDTTPGELVIEDENDSDREWTVMAAALDAINEDRIVTVLMALEYPVWLADAVVTPWAITTSPVNKTVTVGGILPAKPIFRFTAQNFKTGSYGYKKWYPVWNPTDYAAVDYPFEITDGGINTHTLVLAGKMQATTCNDWRLFWGGAQRAKWIANPDTSSSKMWGLFNFAPRVEMTLDGAMASSGTPTTISVKQTVENRQALTRLSTVAHRVLVIGTEAFTFPPGGVSVANYTITITEREAFETTMAAHADDAIVRWPQYGVWMMYGNATVGAQSVDDSKKPLLNLSSSTNNLWVQTEFKAATPRAVSWKDQVIRTLGRLSDTYTDNRNTDVLPATEMGMAMKGYLVANVPKAETATIEWSLTHPFRGFTHVTYTGEKRREKASWPAISGLFKLDDLGRWVAVVNDVTPASLATWTALVAHNSVSLGGSFAGVKFSLSGSLAAILNNAVYYEIDAVTLAINSALRPQTFAGVEQDNYYFDILLENLTNAGWMRVTLPCGIGDVLEIDCNARVVLLNGVNIGVEPIGDWLTADVGTNTYRFTDAGTNDVDGEIEIRDRRIL